MDQPSERRGAFNAAITRLEEEIFLLRDAPRASLEFALLQAKSLGLSFLRACQRRGIEMVEDHRLPDPLNEERKRIRRELVKDIASASDATVTVTGVEARGNE